MDGILFQIAVFENDIATHACMCAFISTSFPAVPLHCLVVSSLLPSFDIDSTLTAEDAYAIEPLRGRLSQCIPARKDLTSVVVCLGEPATACEGLSCGELRQRRSPVSW